MAPVRKRHRRGWGLGLLQAAGFLFAAAMLEVATAGTSAADSNPEIARLVERQSELATQIRDMDAEAKGKALEGEVREKWNEANTEYESNEALLKELRARLERVLVVAGKPEGANNENGSQPFNVPNVTRDRGDIYDLSTIRSSVANRDGARRELVERARIAIDRDAEFPHERADQAKVKEHILHLLRTVEEDRPGALAERILQTGAPTYRRAFWKHIQGNPLTSEEQRALAVGDGTSGAGLAVPYTLDPTIIPTSNGALNPMRQVARIETITGLEWRGVASAGITANRRAEAAETTDNAPTITGPKRSVSRVDVLVPFSLETQLDWPSMEAEMARLIQDAKDEEEAVSFFTGDGTLPNPQGVLTGTTNTVNAAAGADAFTLANLYALKGALPPRYVPSARFMSDTLLADRVRQFDTAGGAGLWTTLGQATPELLLGKPFHEASGMPNDATTGNKFFLYGDFSRYIIVDRLGLTIETVQHLVTTNHRPTGQRALFAYWFNNGFVADANGFRALLGTA